MCAAMCPRPRSAGESDVLLEVTPVTKSGGDVHAVVERIQERAASILLNKLHLESRATMGFAMTLSEACQNIVEHAGRGGWVMVQAYNYRRRLGGRFVVVIAVCDAGVGFRSSLESGQRRPLKRTRWDDAVALEAAVVNGVSHYGDQADAGQETQGHSRIRAPMGRKILRTKRDGAHRSHSELGRRRAAPRKSCVLSGCAIANHHSRKSERGSVTRIDVGSVLRHSANLPFSDLVTRPTIAAVTDGNAFGPALAALSWRRRRCAAGFSHIGMMDYSCADRSRRQAPDRARRPGGACRLYRIPRHHRRAPRGDRSRARAPWPRARRAICRRWRAARRIGHRRRALDLGDRLYTRSSSSAAAGAPDGQPSR